MTYYYNDDDALLKRTAFPGVPEDPLSFEELQSQVLNLPLVKKFAIDQNRFQTLISEHKNDNLENILEYAIASLQQSTDFEQVLELFQAWHSTGNLSGIGLMFYANLCQFAFHDYVKAKFLYESSSKFDPENPITWRLLSSMLYREFHDEDTYNEILTKYRNMPCDSHICYIPVLLRFLLNFVKNDTKAAYTSAVLVKKYVRNKEVAKYLYLQSIKIDPNNSLSHFNVGLIYDNQMRWLLAKHHYLECLRIDQSKHDAWFNLGGVIQESHNDTTRSLKMFQKAIEVKPDEALYCATIAETFHYWVQTTDLVKAEEYYLRALALQDEHRTRINITKLYLQKEEYTKALDNLLPAFFMEDDRQTLRNDSELLWAIIPMLPDEELKRKWNHNQEMYKSLSKKVDMNAENKSIMIDTWLSLPPCLRRVLPAENPDLYEELSKSVSNHYALIFPALENALVDIGADIVIDFLTGVWIAEKAANRKSVN